MGDIKSGRKMNFSFLFLRIRVCFFFFFTSGSLLLITKGRYFIHESVSVLELNVLL